MTEVELLFLGTGTSAGVPMIGCHCAVCRSTDPRDQRTRCSVIIRYDDVQVLVDTSPELRLQCVANGIDRVEAVVFTHAHADHIMGLDDLRRFNAVRRGPLDVFSDDATQRVLEQCFGYAFVEPAPQARLFRPHLVRHRIDGPFAIGGVTWTPVPLRHGDLDVLGFRVGKLAYCTDVNEIPEASFGLLAGLEVLVIDGLQWTTHATHFSLEQAMAAARRIAARQTWFTHMSHQVMHAETDARLPETMRLAYDGLRIRAGLDGSA